MPTLFRLLTTLAILAGIIYGIMAALVYFVEPTRRELTVDVPLPELKPVPRPPEPQPVDPADTGATSDTSVTPTGTDAEALRQ